jgi:hypothetical protein
MLTQEGNILFVYKVLLLFTIFFKYSIFALQFILICVTEKNKIIFRSLCNVVRLIPFTFYKFCSLFSSFMYNETNFMTLSHL